jgi:HAD superfamily hydrolase (TIGR01509 family)
MREQCCQKEDMIKALIFDFDGLILDTETPELRAWQNVYREHGQELTALTWGQIVGGTAASSFEPASHLAALTGNHLDTEALKARVRRESLAQIHRQPALPGVRELIDDARRRGLKLAVASSSPHDWVDGHLARLGLLSLFDVVKAREDVLRTKPEPDLFLAALSGLEVEPGQALALEDSPNGVRAAKRAGLFVVAVPNPVTESLRFEDEDLRLLSLKEIRLPELMRRADSSRS